MLGTPLAPTRNLLFDQEQFFSSSSLLLSSSNNFSSSSNDFLNNQNSNFINLSELDGPSNFSKLSNYNNNSQSRVYDYQRIYNIDSSSSIIHRQSPSILAESPSPLEESSTSQSTTPKSASIRIESPLDDKEYTSFTGICVDTLKEQPQNFKKHFQDLKIRFKNLKENPKTTSQNLMKLSRQKFEIFWSACKLFYHDTRFSLKVVQKKVWSGEQITRREKLQVRFLFFEFPINLT